MAVGGAFLLCILAAGISAPTDLFLSRGPERLDRLDVLDKARLAETLHLQEALGETIGPGFGRAEGPGTRSGSLPGGPAAGGGGGGR